MSEIKLKLCPFCGREAFYNIIGNQYGCRSCQIWMDTAKQWNTRFDERVANIIY